jgi:CO/xanthine dehydrogenase FAD-binding subunit
MQPPASPLTARPALVDCRYTNNQDPGMGRWLRPTAISDALTALAERRWTILAGGTDHFPARLGPPPDEDILDITALPGLRTIEARADGWFIPCGATWTDLIEADLPPAFDGLREASRQVGGVQIQNRGTLVGNLCNASPAADGVPNLLALDAQIVLASAAGQRQMPLGEFILGNRRTARRDDELVLGVFVPTLPTTARGSFLKLGARRYLVISIVMVSAVLDLARDGVVRSARMAVGSCTPVAVRLPALEAALLGRHPSPDLIRAEHLSPLAPIDDVRGSADYRLLAVRELLGRALSVESLAA